MSKLLTWREIRQVVVEDDKLYQALYDIYIDYIGNEDDNIDEIIKCIQDYIEDYTKELIEYASPYDYSTGDIEDEEITSLVTDSSFLEDFKKWYLNK